MRSTPLILILLAVLAVLGGLLAMASSTASRPVHEVLAADSQSGPGVLAPDVQDGTTDADGEESGRVSIDIPPPPPTEEELAALANAPDAQIWGRVLGLGGAPLEGARVIARRCSRWMAMPADLEDIDVWGRGERSFVATTDAEGRFHFDDIEPNEYGFAVRADGYAPLDRLCEKIPEHEQYELGDFQLAQGVVVEGTVTDHRGRPVEGVQVLRAVSSKGGSTRLELVGLGIPVHETGPDGTFRAATLAPGGWHLIFDSPTHRITELTGETEPAGQNERGLRVVLESGLTIDGRVEGLAPTAEQPLRVQARRTDEQPTGETVGVEGAERARSRFTTVAGDGTFHFDGLAPNTQYLLVLQRQVKDDDAELPEEHDPWRSMPGVDDVASMSGEKEVVLRYREESSLTWKIVDSETGAPITNYVARLWGRGLGGAGVLEDESGETDTSHPGGVGSYDHLRPRQSGAESTLFVRAEGYRDLSEDNLLLKPGEAKDLGELKLERAPRVTVRVVDDATGDPIEDARVFLSGPDGEDELDSVVQSDHDHMPTSNRELQAARTSSSGHARITAFAGKLCRVRAVAQGYAPCDSETSAPPHETDLELRLIRCGTVTVRVTNEKGDPAVGVQIRRQFEDGSVSTGNYWDTGQQARESTDETGTLVFGDLRPGRWTFWIVNQREAEMGWFRGPSQAPDDEQTEVSIESGSSEEIEFQVKARGGALVRVTEGGEACVGALVQLKQILPEGSGGEMYWWGGGMDDPQRRVTDHEGRAAFDGLELGRYTATISHPERRMARGFEVLVEEHPEDEQVFELGVTAVEGVVTDLNGDPIAGLRVNINIAEGNNLYANDYRIKVSLDQDGDTDMEWESVEQSSLRTDRDGRYRLDGVRPELPLLVSVRGSYVVPETIRLDALMRDEVRTGVDFALHHAGILDVRVVGVERSVLRNARVRGELVVEEGVEVGSGAAFSSRMRRRTSRRFQSLLPGTWKVELVADDGQTILATGEGTVVVGESRRVEVAPR